MDAKEEIPFLHVHQNGDKSIWAVGGGKGGTGKSFVSANLAIHLAQKGEEVLLIDADLGGPNLHTFLGVKESDIDLGHFITNKVPNLKDTMITTSINGISLIKGTENVLFTSNLNYFKKLKLLRHIKAFDARRIIIDLGTGASFNCVDLFLISNPGILVINPEPTSIENAYYFLKSCIIRIIKMYTQHYKIQDLIDKVSHQIQDTSKSIYDFLNEVMAENSFYANLLYRGLSRFSPCLIINKAKTERDFALGQSMVNVVKKYLGIDMKYIGPIPIDENVHRSLTNLTPFSYSYSHSQAARAFRSIIENLSL